MDGWMDGRKEGRMDGWSVGENENKEDEGNESR